MTQPLSGPFMAGARKAWLTAGVRLQQVEITEAAWELLKQYPSMEEAINALRERPERER